MSRVLILLFFTSLLLLIDFYVFSGFKTLISNSNNGTQKFLKNIYWLVSAVNIALIIIFNILTPQKFWTLRAVIMTFIVAQYLGKFIWLCFLFIDDFIRFIKLIVSYFTVEKTSSTGGISRSDFLVKAGAIAGSGLIASLGWGIARGAYNYKIHRKTIHLKNLPNSFDGIKIVQISDIHSGSFWNKEAVERGVKMAIDQNPDIVFFTGDLVNNEAKEMEPWIDTFAKIQAPMGVFSIFGNHDYGDYVFWNSIDEKTKNIEYLKNIHKKLGWNLLLNQNVKLTKNEESIGIIGVENWSNRGRFKKYGNMELATNDMGNVAVKLLLSHDPSHWRGEILKKYPDIDIMFAGHTHGMQFGVELGKYKWSPVKYMYPEWADLHQSGNQFLYVNRGFGFIGYPGRFGILPEITLIELKRKS
ncbi:MAG: metallophosphoesterase [Bacteroidetes bacterium]|nr:metallophosphoesterase [Bacteroidota bacterium]